MKNQIEERLTFLSTGVKPRKNIDVMKKVHEMLSKGGHVAEKDGSDDETLLKKKTKKKGTKEMKIESDEEVVEVPKKKKKKVVVEEDSD